MTGGPDHGPARFARADDVGVPWLPAAPVDVTEYFTALMRWGAGITTVRQTGSVLSPWLRRAVRRPIVRITPDIKMPREDNFGHGI